MFDGTDAPRLFGLAPGVDFPATLVAGLRARLSGQPPEAMARVELIVNTERMKRRIREIFDTGPPTLVPRLRLLTDLSDPADMSLPVPVSPLRRRLELTGLVSRLLDTQPDLAPRAALFDLADSLATLMDEMQSEGVDPARVAELDVSDQSGHWQRALSFLRIVQRYFDMSDDAPDTAAFQRLALEQRLQRWDREPPDHPVILAGSTGSRGMTAKLMRAVARLPNGAVVVPGFDFDMPQAVWDELTDALTGEDHPQFRFAKLMADLGQSCADVRPWHDAAPPSAARNALVSLSLRPAPVTDQWLSDGPSLPMLPEASQGLTLVEAPGQREEAMAIALRLRQAAEDGQKAALITPDRMLTRQVTAALDRWNILPDDSAGIPAQLSPPGRFLRHIAALFQHELTAESLLTLLKHPLTHRGAGRNQHLLNTRDLELHIRAEGWPYPRAEQITGWGAARDRAGWAQWVADTFCRAPIRATRPLPDWLDDHIARAEAMCAGSDSGDFSELWAENPGREVKRIVEDLRAEAPHGHPLDARDYGNLFGAILATGEVRDRDAVHPHILIWGTLEARVMGADLLILGGLNEGTWPEMPAADPWLNRRMRADAGLLLPERRIGLSAHDYQQAIAAPEVWLTRSRKSDDAETVPSRWLNRLMNLMSGLPMRDGPAALGAMRARGDHWLALARAIEAPIPAAPAARPSPAPPAAARPKQLSVTEIKRLVRDPYAVYARRVLRLRALNPLQRAPDALLRGILVHEVLDAFVRQTVTNAAQNTPETLMAEAARILGDATILPFPTMRHLWQARLGRVASWFCDSEAARQRLAQPVAFEVDGKADLPALGFTLTAQADRIDIDAAGNARLYDYKTGRAPTEKEQQHFDKQLLLEAAMLEQGGFQGLGPLPVTAATFISLANPPQEVPAPFDTAPPVKVWAEFEALIRAYSEPDLGFTARRALLKDSDVSDYDHLSRFGEWDVAQTARKERLT